jgi:hypothetical protein
MSKLTRTTSLHPAGEPRLLPKPPGRPPLPHAWMMRAPAGAAAAAPPVQTVQQFLRRPASANIRGRGAGARGSTARRAPSPPPRPRSPPKTLRARFQEKLKLNFAFNQPHLRGVESRGAWLTAAGRNRRGTMSAALPTRKARSPGRSKLSKTHTRSPSKNRSK